MATRRPSRKKCNNCSGGQANRVLGGSAGSPGWRAGFKPRGPGSHLGGLVGPITPAFVQVQADRAGVASLHPLTAQAS